MESIRNRYKVFYIVGGGGESKRILCLYNVQPRDRDSITIACF